jgi:hypothetical protein
MPNFTDQISQLYNEDKNFQMVSDKAIKEGWAEIEGNLYGTDAKSDDWWGSFDFRGYLFDINIWGGEDFGEHEEDFNVTIYPVDYIEPKGHETNFNIYFTRKIGEII